MIFEKFIEEDLGHVSYIIADDDSREAMIVDPRRDINEYVKFINKNNLKLKFILNTHTHADYIGGHIELVETYPDVKNIFHKNVPAKFEFLAATDNCKIILGNLYLTIMYTPGHTPYCISCIINEDGTDKYIFTGDILFVGDIARPDLLGKELLYDLLEMSYESVSKLWKLDDSLVIFTSHIKGSLCGKNLKNQYFSTIGIEKKTNKSFALSKIDKKRYIDNLKNQILETPIFFKKMSAINIRGPKLLQNITKVQYLKKKDFFNFLNKDSFVIDFRHPNCFKSGYIKNSINVYEFSNILLIIGSLIEIESELFLVGGKNTNFKNIIKKLRRIGFDNIKAVLDEDVNELEDVVMFEEQPKEKILNLDISKDIGDITCEISQIRYLDIDSSYNVICKNGYKSIAVASFLLKKDNE